MLATPAPALPRGDRWTYEVKWDGYRTLASKDGATVRLFSRNLKDATATFPTVAKEVGRLPAESALLDGEVVALGDDGRPSFQALQHGRRGNRTVFCAFDLLELDGRNLIGLPLEQRRAALASILTTSTILRSEPLPGEPEQIEQAVREMGLEGVVAKRRDSKYEPGERSKAWVKVRFNRRQEFVVGGYKPGLDSLLVGYYQRRQLWFASLVRSGLTPHLRRSLLEVWAPLKRVDCPFVNLPNAKRSSSWGEGVTAEDMKTITWVDPRVVVEVAFVEWTDEGVLRHAVFVGVRSDKPARNVRRET